MFSQSADQPAAEQTDAPAGMRELPPQPAKPVMPAYATNPAAAATPAPAAVEGAPGPDDSVIARDDHLEGTFTSRGTVVVMGSVKGRIEAVRVRIEDGASVDADVIVDEAIVAGEFTGNLTCRERLEARASGRINGRVETFRLMLHEGASVEGEMHMLAESPKDASETVRGSAPLRRDTGSDAAKDREPAAGSSRTAPAAGAASATPTSSPGAMPSPKTAASTPSAGGAPAPSITLPPTPKASAASDQPEAAAPTSTTTPANAQAVRSSVAETLRAESMRLAPRTTTVRSTSRGYGSSSGSTTPSGSTSDGRRGSPSTTGI